MALPAIQTAGEGVVGRMAPTPSAGLHIGNIFSCLIAWLAAKSAAGRIILRIEDVDRERCRQEHIDTILFDLERLGLVWDNEEILYQTSRTEAYDRACDALKGAGLLYPCFCSRADLHAASAPHRGERFVYAGTCRHVTGEERETLCRSRRFALRLEVPDENFIIQDAIQGSFTQNLAHECGDFIIRRSDGIYSYQLAVVVDDLAQGVTQVVRGVDLLECAPQQEYLRKLLDPTAKPLSYAHIPLLLDENGRRLAKRDRDIGVSGLLEHFGTVERLLGHLAHLTGLRSTAEPTTVQELLDGFSFEALQGKQSITWKMPGE
ncbi:MAG: tRNA glutamyl-Q(34) synthetase GluQRS [Coriobacteriia bacterium]|nr:tRNA glutamyl-Q(34) synthetase GluQRS [Coriobacteriia bacterium]